MSDGVAARRIEGSAMPGLLSLVSLVTSLMALTQLANGFTGLVLGAAAVAAALASRRWLRRFPASRGWTLGLVGFLLGAFALLVTALPVLASGVMWLTSLSSPGTVWGS